MAELYREYDDGMSMGRFNALDIDERRELAVYGEARRQFLGRFDAAKQVLSGRAEKQSIAALGEAAIDREKKVVCIESIESVKTCIKMRGQGLPSQQRAIEVFRADIAAARGRKGEGRKRKYQQKALWGY